MSSGSPSIDAGAASSAAADDLFPHYTRIMNERAASVKAKGTGAGPYSGKGCNALLPTQPAGPPPFVAEGLSKGDFADGKPRFGQMSKKQQLHGDQIEELQRVVLLQTQKLKDQALKIESQEQRSEQQDERLDELEKRSIKQYERIQKLEETSAETARQLAWTLRMLDRTLQLPVGGEGSSEH